MDKILNRFFVKIGFDKKKSSEEFADASFLNICSLKEANLVKGTIKLKSYVSYKAFADLFDSIDEFLKRDEFGIDLSFFYEQNSDEKGKITSIINSYCDTFSSSLLKDYQIFDVQKKIIFFYDDSKDTNNIIAQASNFALFLKRISCSYKVMTQERVTQTTLLKKQIEIQDEKKKDLLASKEYFKRKEELLNTYTCCKIKDIENFPKVTIEGKIYSSEVRVTKKEKSIKKLCISDFSDSIFAFLFESKDMSKDDMEGFDVGVKVRIKGRPTFDSFTNRLTLQVDEIEKIDDVILREDRAEEKRVELHLHTKMSPFDGVSEIEQYVKMAKKFSMKAIAVTDHDGVQAFPNAQKAGKDNGIKIIYGCELSMIDDDKDLKEAIYNPSDIKLAKATYVVFDIETTGLSNRYDDIIEFGAVRYTSRFELLDEFNFFIKSDKKLSKFTLESSNITEEDVMSGKDIKTALKTIKEIFSDSIIVAHNAYFDYDFINEKLEENGMEKIKNPVIDTLPLARFLFPDYKSYREESIAKNLGLSFSSSSAHRANYDAMHLAEIFFIMLPMLFEINKDMRHKDIGEFKYTEDVLMSLHPYHVILLAKNQKGLKDLYKIVSDVSIKHLSKVGNPLLLKSVLNEYRDDILVGSACLNSKLFEVASTKSISKLEEVIDEYDYIEVQPPMVYSYLVNKGQIDDLDEVKSIIKDIIYTAKRKNKLVVATSDCHYVSKEDKIFRDIMIANKGLRNIRHPLCLMPRDNDSEEEKNKYYKNPIPNPDQMFLSTDEMKEAFSFLNDDKLIDEIVVKNTNIISDMIEDVEACKSDTYPPFLPGSDEKLTSLVYFTAKKMYGDPLPEIIEERLKEELKGIIAGGYSVHYYISSLIIKWCNENDYIVGSRGSVGSSLVATMSGITEVNPLPPHYYCPDCHYIEWADVLKYESGIDLEEKECPVCHRKLIRDGQNIPFATFLGFKAEKVPDIDLNFPSDFQAAAHLKMREILNETGNVCYKAGTIQTLKDKKAYACVLNYYESLGIPSSKVRDAQIEFLAKNIFGIKTSTGQHPGGIIVIPKGMEVSDFTPVQYPAGKRDAQWETTHFDFHAIHDNVLKFDMLAHQDPVAIKMMCDLCNIDINDMNKKIPLSDADALSIFWSAEKLNLKENRLNEVTGALGLPEFGTVIGRRTLIETKAHSFADLVRISGLSHGTDVYSGNARELILDEGKSLRDVIACRDDIMVRLHEDYGIEYTDSFKIMELVRKGNFCKKKFAEEREKYTQLMKDHGVPDFYIRSCEKIKYLFPRGHAVAYVSMAVRVAFFKVHYPLEYYATYFTVRANAYDIMSMEEGIDVCCRRLEEVKERKKTGKSTVKDDDLIDCYEQSIEMLDRGFSFAKMDINTCHSTKFLIDKENKALIPPLIVIDGIGEILCNQIIENREKEGPFSSVEDLQNRTSIGSSSIEKLRDYGLFDSIPEDDQIRLF